MVHLQDVTYSLVSRVNGELTDLALCDASCTVRDRIAKGKKLLTWKKCGAAGCSFAATLVKKNPFQILSSGRRT